MVEYRADYMNKGRADSADEYLRSSLPWKRVVLWPMFIN